MEIFIYIAILVVSVCSAACFGHHVAKHNNEPERSKAWKKGHDVGYERGAQYVLSALRPVVKRMNDTYRKQAN